MTVPPIIWHENYEADIGVHVFPTRKYRAVRDRLIGERLITEDDIRRPEPATDEQIGLVHTHTYVEKLRRGDFSRPDALLLELPFSEELRTAMWLCTGGSVLTARLALEHGLAVHLGGGFHHAFPDHGEGFCLINDVAIAVRVLIHEGAIERAAIIDCDVHHGNGTAMIFRDDASVFTFSMHQENNYPAWKPPSDLDLGLADGVGDSEYLSLIDRHLPVVLQSHPPDLLYYLAGADPYEDDQLGGLGLTLEGLQRRDARVYELAAHASVPVAVALAGGYARRFEDTVEIHCQTVRTACEALSA